jgi:hypothetical protein
MGLFIEPLTQRSRAIFSLARLSYWDDGPASTEIKRLHDGLGPPVSVAVSGGAVDDRAALTRAVARAGSGLVRVVDASPEAVVLLLDGGSVATTTRECTLGVLLAGADADASVAGSRVREVVSVDGRFDHADLARLRAALESLAADVDTMRHVLALWRLRRLVVAAPRKGVDAICEAIDDIELDGPEPRELIAAMELRAGGADDLAPADRTVALAVLDAARAVQSHRLARDGAPLTTDDLAQWRTLASDPTLSRKTRDLATTVGRACERLLARSD